LIFEPFFDTIFELVDVFSFYSRSLGNTPNHMQKRDTIVLFIAVLCGALAFVLVFNVLKNSQPKQDVIALPKGKDSLPIPQGMSALSLTPNELENIPDFIKVGLYVDLLGIAPNYSGKLELQTIVRSAQVLSVKKGEKGSTQSITVALSPVAVEVVSKAIAEGKIRIIPRPDAGERAVLRMGDPGVTEVIRGVTKQKSVRVQ
jgi:hypothetical protein